MTGTALAWRYTAGPFKAFGHRFAIRTTDEEFAAYLNELWRACRADEEPDTRYGFEVVVVNEATAYRLHADEGVREFSNPSVALRDLVRRVNADTIQRAGDLVVVHAAGAVRHGAGVLFPAVMEGGKTTLVAGLVRAGWGYLSDEAVGIEPQTLALQPYPKPLSVDPGSWEVLADLRPQLPDALTPYGTEQWQVPPEQIRPGAVAGPVPSVAVVGPVYESGAATRLEPLSKAEALVLLAESCFTLGGRGTRSLNALAALTRRCACYRLTVGDLAKACVLVNEALEAATQGSRS